MEEHKRHEHHIGEHAHHEEHSHTKPNIKLWIMAVALGLLIILSGVQAVELVSLKNKLNKEVTSLASGKSTASSGLSDNLKNLPSMVGGC